MPDSKVASIGIICIAVIASAFIYSHRATLFAPNTKYSLPTTSLVSSPLSYGSTTPDTADWKQALNNINIITPASASADAVADQQSGNDTTSDPNNLTAQVSKNFFSLYMQDQQNGVTVDDTEATNIADESLSNLPTLPPAKQYGITDITIEKSVTPTTRHTYGVALAAAIDTNSPGGDNELDILNNATEASQNGQTPDLSGLNPIIKGYTGMIASVLKIPVPSDAVGLDIVFLNTSSDILTDIQGMSQLNSDPIVAYAAFTNYQKDAVAFSAIFDDLNAYFSQ